jgi:hypothetical protein
MKLLLKSSFFAFCVSSVTFRSSSRPLLLDWQIRQIFIYPFSFESVVPEKIFDHQIADIPFSLIFNVYRKTADPSSAPED